MLFGRRLPLHILFLCKQDFPIIKLATPNLIFPSSDSVFYYHALWAVSKLKLKCAATEHIAVGLLSVLMDLPYDIASVRFVHWVWHDTDPNIFDRHYFVPWTSYFFHFTFSCSMSFIFHKSRSVLEKRKLDKWQRGSMISELFSVLMVSVLSMPMGALMFTISYHVLHDFLLIHTETVVIPIFAILILIVWMKDRNSNRGPSTVSRSATEKLLYAYLVVHYSVFIVISTVFSPETHFSTSFHEPIGDCTKMTKVQTLLKNLEKREFLCITDYDEKYFDFQCLKEVPAPGSNWYTVCGTPFE